MKSLYSALKETFIYPLKNWIRKLIHEKDDDDNSFNHPWAIF